MYAFLEQRRTVRKYLDREVEPEKLARIARAAALAPSAHHTTPWRLAVMTELHVKRRLAEAMAHSWDQEMLAEGVPEPVRSGRLTGSVNRLGGAPALILASLDSRLLPPGDTPQSRCEEVMLIQSVAAAVYAVLLAAAAEGLGAAWICAPLFCPGAVRDALGLPEYLVSQALITVGYPAAAPGPRLLRDVESAVMWMR